MFDVTDSKKLEMLFIQNSNGLTPIDIALEISKDGDGSLLKKKDAVEKEETKLTKFQKSLCKLS